MLYECHIFFLVLNCLHSVIMVIWVLKCLEVQRSVSSLNTKRIMISLPDQLLREVDGIVELEKSNRSELIRQAMRLYLGERKKRTLRESMQRGYMEMAKINLHIASEAFQAEEDAGGTVDRLVSGV